MTNTAKWNLARTKFWLKSNWKKALAVLSFLTVLISLIGFVFPDYRGVFKSGPDIPYYVGDLNITFPNEPDDNLLEFLDVNKRNVVFLNLHIEMSLWFDFNYEVLKNCQFSLTVEEYEKIYNKHLYIPIYKEPAKNEAEKIESEKFTKRPYTCYDTLKIISDKNTAVLSHGGTGIVQSTLTGFYSVEYSVSGSSRTYIISEQPADPELYAKYQKLK